jgi:predicted RNA binding protein YcfA (HicA-like mRNA interferase family)
MTHSLKNIGLKNFQKFLLHQGLTHIRSKGSHEIWSRKDLTRPVIIQSNIDPVPKFIIKNCLRTLGLTNEDLSNFLESKN